MIRGTSYSGQTVRTGSLGIFSFGRYWVFSGAEGDGVQRLEHRHAFANIDNILLPMAVGSMLGTLICTARPRGPVWLIRRSHFNLIRKIKEKIGKYVTINCDIFRNRQLGDEVVVAIGELMVLIDLPVASSEDEDLDVLVCQVTHHLRQIGGIHPGFQRHRIDQVGAQQ
jgi:hypothetical protein